MTAKEIVEKWVDFPPDEMAEMRADIEALVEAEREACAKVAEEAGPKFWNKRMSEAANCIADYIRARGEAKEGE